jgi:hypothetical protein
MSASRTATGTVCRPFTTGAGQARSLTRFVFISCLFSMKCQPLRKVEKIFHMKKI